jgi:hypothetical protein
MTHFYFLSNTHFGSHYNKKPLEISGIKTSVLMHFLISKIINNEEQKLIWREPHLTA